MRAIIVSCLKQPKESLWEEVNTTYTIMSASAYTLSTEIGSTLQGGGLLDCSDEHEGEG